MGRKTSAPGANDPRIPYLFYQIHSHTPLYSKLQSSSMMPTTTASTGTSSLPSMRLAEGAGGDDHAIADASADDVNDDDPLAGIAATANDLRLHQLESIQRLCFAR